MINIEQVQEIKKTLQSRNKFTIPDQLFNLTKFSTNGPQLTLTQLKLNYSKRKQKKKILKSNFFINETLIYSYLFLFFLFLFIKIIRLVLI